MTQDDVLFGHRLQLFDYAARTNVAHACRTFGVHRSTYYRWKRQVDACGLEMLRPRERRRPQMPNAFPRIVEERILAFSIANPGLGPRRLAVQLERHSGIRASANGIWRVLRRHGLSTRAKRLALVAGYRCPYEPPREPWPEPHVDSDHSGELVGIDCFFVGRLHGSKGPIWQLTACDTCSSFAWGGAGQLPGVRAHGGPDDGAGAPGRGRAWPRGLALRAGAHRQRQRVRPPGVRWRAEGHGHRPHPDPRRAPAVKWPRRAPAPHDPRGVLAPGLCPLSEGPLHGTQARPRDLPRLLQQRARARTRAATHEAGLRPTSSTVLARWSRDEPRVSADLGGCSA